MSLEKVSEKFNLVRVYLNVPYNKKDEAKKSGARWSADRKLWYIIHNKIENIS